MHFFLQPSTSGLFELSLQKTHRNGTIWVWKREEDEGILVPECSNNRCTNTAGIQWWSRVRIDQYSAGFDRFEDRRDQTDEQTGDRVLRKRYTKRCRGQPAERPGHRGHEWRPVDQCQCCIVKQLWNWKVLVILCLTIGLAPFNPPHIWEDLKWVWGGAVGMKAINWFDLAMHGTPWVLLVVHGFQQLIRRSRS